MKTISDITNEAARNEALRLWTSGSNYVVLTVCCRHVTNCAQTYEGAIYMADGDVARVVDLAGEPMPSNYPACWR